MDKKLKKKALIIPAKTIGDALILMILAAHLKQKNYDVTIMHDNIFTLKNWFLNYNFKSFSSNSSKITTYDHIFLQYDSSNPKELNKIIKNAERTKNQNLSIIYFLYNRSKHAPLTKLDITLSNKELPIAQGLALSLKSFFNLKKESTQTQITIPKNLIYQKYPERIIIHPTSSDKKKCWHKSKFIKLCKKLKKSGFHLCIAVAKEERKNWLFCLELGIDLPLFYNLTDFANYVYESGFLIGNDSFAVHLSSLLKIKHIMIAKNKNLAKRWQSGWLKANIVLPSSYIPNFKYFRIREKYFQYFISTKKVFKTFMLNK